MEVVGFFTISQQNPREFDEQFIGIITSAKAVVGFSFVSQHTRRGNNCFTCKAHT